MSIQDEKIVSVLLEHSKGKLCSRYTLGLERALHSIKKGSPREALEEQEAWYEARTKRKTKPKAKKTPTKVVMKPEVIKKPKGTRKKIVSVEKCVGKPTISRVIVGSP